MMLNSCRARRGTRCRACLAGILILFVFSNTRAGSNFPGFWQKFKSRIIAGDKVSVTGMTKFPLAMPYGVKAVKNSEDFLRRYDEIFKGETDAARCFASTKPKKESDRRYTIYCPFKETPDDRENTPIRFIFERAKGGWKFVALDNINE
jgi:hypothetical protein